MSPGETENGGTRGHLYKNSLWWSCDEIRI